MTLLRGKSRASTIILSFPSNLENSSTTEKHIWVTNDERAQARDNAIKISYEKNRLTEHVRRKNGKKSVESIGIRWKRTVTVDSHETTSGNS